MTALEQVAALKQQAVTILLNERERIDTELSLLGATEKGPGKKRGPKPRTTEPEVTGQPASLF